MWISNKLFLRIFMLCGMLGAWLQMESHEAQAQIVDKVSLFVEGVDQKTDRLAAWVEGVWMNYLRSRLQEAEQSLGGIPSDKADLLKQASVAFQEGKKAFEDLNPDLALRKFQESLNKYEQSSAYVWDLREAGMAWIYIGVNYLLSGNHKEAEDAFRRGLLWVPDISIKSVTTEKDNVQVFEKIKEQVISTRAAGQMDVHSQPAAAVFINGKFHGATPLKISLSPGRYLISLRREGYRAWGEPLDITASGSRVFKKMEPIETYTNWQQMGNLAVQNVDPSNEYPTAVAAFGALVQSRLILMAKARWLEEGKSVAIQAVVYDTVQKKQLATGGAIVEWWKGIALTQRLAEALLAKESVRLGGWPPEDQKPPPPPRRSYVGVWVGVTLGVAALAAGGVFLGLYLTRPQCSDKGSCIELKLE